MNVTKTTLKVQASFNYQVSSLEVELEDYTEEELEDYTNYLSEICCNNVKVLSEKVGPTHSQDQKPVVQTQRSVRQPETIQQPQNTPNHYRYGNSPRNQQNPSNYVGSGRSTSPSFSQVQMLKRLGYTDDQLSVMSKAEATEIIRNYQISTGYQQN